MAKVTEAHKAGNKRWDSENMLTLSVRLRREHVERFRAVAQAEGTSANQLLKRFVLSKIGEPDSSEKVTAENSAATSAQNSADLIKAKNSAVTQGKKADS